MIHNKTRLIVTSVTGKLVFFYYLCVIVSDSRYAICDISRRDPIRVHWHWGEQILVYFIRAEAHTCIHIMFVFIRSDLAAFLYPTYASFKSLKTANSEDDTLW